MFCKGFRASLRFRGQEQESRSEMNEAVSWFLQKLSNRRPRLPRQRCCLFVCLSRGPSQGCFDALELLPPTWISFGFGWRFQKPSVLVRRDYLLEIKSEIGFTIQSKPYVPHYVNVGSFGRRRSNSRC